jgi:hypothetical protein
VNSFFAYALLIIGIPLFVGMAVGSVLTIPIAWLLRSKTKVSMTNLLYLEGVNGFAAACAGAFLFRIFGLTPGIAVPVIIAAWVTVYFFWYHQPKSAWVSWLAGIFIGWFTLGKMIATS